MTLSPTGQFQPFDSDKRYQRRMSYTDIWIDARESKEGCVSDTPNGKDAADADRLLNLKNHIQQFSDSIRLTHADIHWQIRLYFLHRNHHGRNHV